MLPQCYPDNDTQTQLLASDGKFLNKPNENISPSQELRKEPDSVQVLLDSARSQSLINPGLAAELAQIAYEMVHTSDDKILISNVLNALSITHYYMGKNQESLNYLIEAIANIHQVISDNPVNINIMRRLQMMYSNAGNIYQSIGVHEKALEMHLKALQLIDSLFQLDTHHPENIPQKIKALNNTAVLYWSMKETGKAIPLLDEALLLGYKLQQPANIIFTLNNIGLIQIEKKEYEKALKTFNEALDIGKQLNDSIGISGNYNNLGLIMEKTSQSEQALRYYLKSFQISRRLGYSIGISNTCSNIGRIYNELNQTDSAVYYSMLGAEEATVAKSNVYLAKNYETLYKVYQKAGNYQKALEFYSLFRTVSDSIFSEDKNRLIAEMEARYENDKKEKQNQILKQQTEIQQQRIAIQHRTNIFTVVAGIILILLVLLLFNFYRLKANSLQQKTILLEKDQRLQELEKARLEDQLFAEKEIVRLQNEKLEQKNRELSSRILHVISKNDMMNNILEEINQHKTKIKPDTEECFSNLSKLVKENINLDGEWDQFKLHFEEVNPGFFAHLQSNFPDLTAAEQKLCAYYRINLDTKEIARMLNITPSAVQKSRHRLRKKMNIPSELEMNDFVSRF